MSDWIRDAAHEAMRDLVEALQAMRGVALVVAVTVVAEVGDFRRFANARQLMAHLGLLPSDPASGSTVRRGGIAKAGNAQGTILSETLKTNMRTGYRKMHERRHSGAGIAREPGTTVSFSTSC